MASNADIPPDSFLTRVHWDLDRAKAAKYVEWRDGEPWIGDRRLVTTDKVLSVLRAEYRKVPPAMGYIRWYSLITRKYIGISRPALMRFLANQEGRQLYRERRNIVGTRAIIIKKPGVVFTADLSYPSGSTATRWRGRKCVALFSIIDQHSKFVYSAPVSGVDMAEMIRVTEAFLDSIGDKARRVKIIRTDGGFGQEYTDWAKEQGIRHSVSRAWRPQSNGLVERLQKTLGSYLRSTAEYRLGDKKRWPEAVSDVTDLINDSWSRVLLKTPREVFEGEDAGDPAIVQRIVSEGKKRLHSSLYDRHPLMPGDYVRVSLRASGPSTIKSKIKAANYKGYAQQWSDPASTRVGENDIRQVKRRIRPETYELTDGTTVDRADLLKIPTADPEVSRRGAP